MDARLSGEVLKSLFRYSDDGFIVIDAHGIVQDINEQYASYFPKTRDEIIGHPIEETISTTSMYDVLNNGLFDNREDVYLQPYTGEDLRQDGLRQEAEIRIAAKRFCVYDDQHRLLGAAAQMKFPDRAEEISRKYKEAELDYYKESYQDAVFSKSGFENMLGRDPKVLKIKNMGIRAARSDFPILITGETGTGKEVMAKSIHLASSRSEKPFVAINCGAIPENLLESELFGYEGGAFTGAKRGGKPGKFEQADGGTIFLDEIGDMPLHMQVKLLRVLQEHEIDRVGGSKPVRVNVRVLSATRRNLQEMMAQGTFREDLYYRLAVVNIQTVPLRECPGDILQHAFHHLGRLNQQYRTEITLSESAKQCLLAHSWPGNIRELQNVLSSAYAMCEDDVIQPENFPQRIARHSKKNKPIYPIHKEDDRSAENGTGQGGFGTGQGRSRIGQGESATGQGRSRIGQGEFATGQGRSRIGQGENRLGSAAAAAQTGTEAAGGADTAGPAAGSDSPGPGFYAEPSLPLKEKLRQYERTLISEALQACGGNMTETAKKLQVERSLLYKKMQKFGMK